MTRSFHPLDRFYPIVENADWILRVVAAGAKLVQLRMKDASAFDIARDVERAKSMCDAAGVQLVVNDHWRAAIEFGCDFVHLGQGDLDSADIKAVRKAGVRLGVSTHDHAELDRALSYDPDYVALGPIYPTMLKEMPWAPQGLERVGEWKRLVGVRPLVAIGGLTIDRAVQCLAAGADSVAVVTDITRSDDPESQMKAWMTATRA